MRDYRDTLEIEGPSASCGACRFMSALKGTWSVEDGRLVWRADPEPQPRRGPDLESCCEGRECGEFRRITADDEELSSEDIATIRATAAQARERQYAEWESGK